MFWYAENFNQPIAKWNTSNVTNMSGMFKDSYEFNQYIGDWDMSNVTEKTECLQEHLCLINNWRLGYE